MKQYLKADVIKNLSLNITTEGTVGDIITNSFNLLNKSHINFRDSSRYAELEFRKFSTVYTVFKGSGFVTGKLLLNSIIKNFKLKGLDIESTNDVNNMKRYYKISIEVEKFIESFDDMQSLMDEDNYEIHPNALLLQFTKIGLLFDRERSYNKIDMSIDEFLDISKTTIHELASSNRTLTAISTNKLLGLILKAINLIFGFAMIPIETIEINEVLSSMVLTEDEHTPGLIDHPEHHIFSKILYGFELYDSIENLLNLKSNKGNFTNKLKKLLYDPYSNKYTSKTLVNYSGENATSYLISKRDFHRTNSVSYAVFSYDQLVKNKTYENKGDLSIKKMMDPPVFIYKYGEDLKKYENTKTAIINIYTNAMAVPTEIKREPIITLDPICKKQMGDDTAIAIAVEMVKRFSLLPEVMLTYEEEVNVKKKSYNSSLEAVHNWSLNMAIMDKINCLKVGERRLRALLLACVTYTIELTMNSCTDAALESKILSIVNNKEFYPVRFSDSRILKDLLLDCKDFYKSKKQDYANRNMASIVTTTITHIGATMRSPVAATLLPGMVMNIIQTIMKIIDYDIGVMKYRRKYLKNDMYNKSEYFLVQGFGKGIFPCEFIAPGVLNIRELSDYMQYHIFKAATSSCIER